MYYFFQKLTRGKDNWSLSELMQAICLMAHFHAMCSFVYGCGVRNELDHNGESLHRRLSMSDDSDSDTQVLAMTWEVLFLGQFEINIIYLFLTTVPSK